MNALLTDTEGQGIACLPIAAWPRPSIARAMPVLFFLAGKPEVFRGESDLLLHRFGEEMGVGVLGEVADLRGNGGHWLSGDRPAHDDHPPAVGLKQPVCVAQQRGFS